MTNDKQPGEPSIASDQLQKIIEEQRGEIEHQISEALSIHETLVITDDTTKNTYVSPCNLPGHPCYECVFNVKDLDNWHTTSHICCNPLSPYHCIETHVPVCTMNTPKERLAGLWLKQHKPWVFNPAHELYKADDPEVQKDEFLYSQVAEGGLGICKKCGKSEAQLNEECK